MDGHVTEFPLAPNAIPSGIARGSDGNLWFLEEGAAKVGRITPSGVVTEFDIAPGFIPYAINADWAGNIWYGEFNGAINTTRIERVDGSGKSLQMAVLANGPNITDLIEGIDGAMWFTAGNLNEIERLAADGSVTVRSAPAPVALVIGPDGALWFSTGRTANYIGRMTV
jgi:virginiamycin B lyase